MVFEDEFMDKQSEIISILDKNKIKTVFGVEVPYWTDSLKKCITNLKSM